MELESQAPYMTPAQYLAFIVAETFRIAIDVALTREHDPNFYPIFPPNVDHEFWARRLLGDFVEAGIRPDGWETEFFADGGGK
jgi:hypothetical protein